MSIYEISGKSLANLIVVSLFAGMVGGLTCAILSLRLPSVITSGYAPYFQILLSAMLIIGLFLAIYYWGVVSRRHIRRYGDKFK